MSKNQDFIKYLNEASKTVEQWPTWKKNGSDATYQQSNTKTVDSKPSGQAVFVNAKSR